MNVRWAPRVSRAKILQLYEKMSTGIFDEDLIDEVAYAFYPRIEDMLRIQRHRVRCPRCRNQFTCRPGETVTCDRCLCTVGWEE